MKPVLLILKNVGPYLNEKVDFSQLENMFLIYGNTGAGKTFIFDAMTFALYGRLCGARGGKQATIRSNYAEASGGGFVDFTFLANGTNYRIYRTLEYQRVNKNGRVVNVASEVRFARMDGNTPIPFNEKTAEANEHIKNIIGLSCEEFSQVVLLPQGEFATFLRQNSKNRKDMLSKLFPIERYTSMVDKVKDDCAELDAKIKAQAARLNALCQDADFKDADTKINEMRRNILLAENAADTFRGEQRVLAAKIENLHGRIEKATKAQENRKKLADREARIPGSKVCEERLNKAKDALLLKQAIESRNKSKERYAKLQAAYAATKAAYTKAQNEMAETQKDAAAIEVLRTKNEHDKETVARMQSKMEDARRFVISEYMAKIKAGASSKDVADAKCYDTINQELQEAAQEVEDAQKRDALILSLDAATKQSAMCAKDLAAAKEKSENNAKSLNEAKAALERQKLHNLAFSVAKDLQEGQPCPVCGSLNHPKIAQDSAGISLLEKNVQSFETATVQLVDAVMAEERRFSSLESTVKSKNEQLLQYSALKPTQDILTKYIAALQKYIDAKSFYETIYYQQNIDAKKIHNYDEVSQRAQRQFVKAEADYQNATKSTEDAKAALKEDEDALFAKISASPFATESEVMAAMMDEEKIQHDTDFLQNFRDELKKLQGAVEDNPNPEDPTALSKEKESFVTQQNALDAKIKQKAEEGRLLQQQCNRYENAYKDFQKTQAEFDTMQSQFAPLKRLSDDLQGKNPKKLPFTAWILGMKFEEIINAASVRFNDLSRGRYKFIPDLEGGKSGYRGLDIKVLDSFTGVARDVATLSGGETFEASISLALATTDVLMSDNGAVYLDSLFIDEGFGTLDGDTMDRAMEILTELQETKMVGIISHVENLRSFIPSRIEIEKTSSGSHIHVHP